jgi:hypothetical protein
MSYSQAGHLRGRAQHLVELAAEIERSAVLGLESAADHGTWRGQSPLLCVNLLATNQRQLHDAIDGLRWRAYLLEQQAQQLEAAALDLRSA